MSKITFKTGNIVTIKSHPMAFQKDGKIDSFISHIPPLMCIKEIHVERKKELYSKESEGKIITDKVKYLCTYFNQHRTTFEDKFVYQEMLISFKDLLFYRKNEKNGEQHTTLINETINYDTADYNYGTRVFFKTYKLEKRKSFASAGVNPSNSKKSLMTHTPPAFILSGFKKNENKNFYDSKNGLLVRENADILYKVMWYDSYQEKYREEYQPKEFFTKDVQIYGEQKVETAPPLPPNI